MHSCHGPRNVHFIWTFHTVWPIYCHNFNMLTHLYSLGLNYILLPDVPVRAVGPCGQLCMPHHWRCCWHCIRQVTECKLILLINRLNLKIRHGVIAENIVINLCANFNYDQLWNEKVVVLWKSDNNNNNNNPKNNNNKNKNNVCTS